MDLHKMMAALYEGVKLSEVTSQMRHDSKTRNFFGFYGGSGMVGNADVGNVLDFGKLAEELKTELLEKGLATEDDFKEIKMNEIQPGDIIQIINTNHKWYPCLLIVSEVKSWGVVADAIIPTVDGVGIAPIRIETGKYEKVGVALITGELDNG